jgi:hypothetical protein
MPLDVLGRTRATLMHSTSLTLTERSGKPSNLHRDGDRLLQLLIFNEEYLVSACHQRALITSLPFVHTARRSYRLNDPVRSPDCGNAAGSPAAMPREAAQTLSFRGRRSRNKVSVGEPAEGSLPVFPPALCVQFESPTGARSAVWWAAFLCVGVDARAELGSGRVSASAQALRCVRVGDMLRLRDVWSGAAAACVPCGACIVVRVAGASPPRARVA